jgi:hypothetical protein
MLKIKFLEGRINLEKKDFKQAEFLLRDVHRKFNEAGMIAAANQVSHYLQSFP